jgi:hypothetical protein
MSQVGNRYSLTKSVISKKLSWLKQTKSFTNGLFFLYQNKIEHSHVLDACWFLNQAIAELQNNNFYSVKKEKI